MEYPLLFRIAHFVRCGEFEGKVVTDGRVLVVLEDGEWWCHGVEPGGMTESGPTPLKAFESFRRAYCEVLTDLTEGCGGFDNFWKELQSVFHQDRAEAARWEHANATIDADHMDEEMRRLPRMNPRDSKISVQYIEHSVAPDPETEVGLAEAA